MRLEPLLTLGEAGLRFSPRPQMLACDPRGAVVWIGGPDGVMRYDVLREEVRSMRLRAGVRACTLDAQKMLAWGPQGLWLMDTTSGRITLYWQGPSPHEVPRALEAIAHPSLRALDKNEGLQLCFLAGPPWVHITSRVTLIPRPFRGRANLSPDATRACAWEGDRVRMFETQRGREVADRRFEATVVGAGWRDERSLLIVDEKGLVCCSAVDLTTRAWERCSAASPALALALSPDRSACAVVGATHIEVLETARGESLGTLRLPNATPVDGTVEPIVAVGPGGAWIACIDAAGTLRILDVRTDEPRTLGGLVESDITSITWSGDGRTLASAARADPTVRVWDVERAEVAHVFEVSDGPIDHHALSPDGTRHATASSTGVLRVWEVASGAILAAWDAEGRASCLRWSTDGEKVVVGVRRGDDHLLACLDCLLRLRWSSSSHSYTALRTARPMAFRAVRWSNDLSQVYAAIDDERLVIDGSTGKLVRWQGFRSSRPLACAEIVDDGARLIFTTQRDPTRSDRAAEFGEARFGRSTWSRRYEVADGSTAVFDPSGLWCALAARDRVDVWSVSAGRRVSSWSSAHPGERITALAFSPDGDVLAAGTSSGVVRMFRVAE